MVKQLDLGDGQFGIVDDDVYEFVSRWKWHAKPRRYGGKSDVTRTATGADGQMFTVYLHRQIMAAPHGMQIDHINGDPLDNRISNLRFATASQNCTNRHHERVKAPYRGLRKQRRGGWQVQCRVNGTVRTFGTYACPLEAARVYDDVARQHHGQFAVLNFPD